MLTYIFKFFKIILKGGFSFIALFLLYMLGNHIIAPKYTFPAAVPFQGNMFYNPYADLDSINWHRSNFHMHSHAWGGITNGKGTEDKHVWEVYRNLGFTSIGISNYQNINELNKDSSFYIPVYEHGYGIYKNHQLCLGAKKVVWFDMPYKQTLSQKQFMIDKLKKHTELISINHPGFFGGYSPEDFSQLTGYDFIEALNGYRNSIPHWDSALSAGRPAFLMANDDMHNLKDPLEPARRFIAINAPSNSQKDIFKALKAGNSYGVYIINPDDETLDKKKTRLQNLAVLKSVTISNDTLFVTLDKEAKEFRFWGNHGLLVGKMAHTQQGFYVLKPEDTYVRTHIIFESPNDPEGIQYFLNPVLRSVDGNKPTMPLANIDTRATIVFRIIAVASLFFILINIYILRKRFKRKR